jgi:dinuclear metal center YbgI/SA1388 family protein
VAAEHPAGMVDRGNEGTGGAGAAGAPAGVSLSTLAAHIDELLGARQGHDFCPNGLQVEGRPVVQRLVTGVSACVELFARAEAAGADAVLVHHGLFWDGTPRTLTGYQFQRVAALIRSGMALLAYHLPLDRDPELGNNALAARAFGLTAVEPLGEHGGLPLGCHGRLPEPLPAAGLVDLCRRVFGQEPLAFLGGRDPVSTIGLISGGAQREVHAAIAAGLDAYVTGEVSEWVMNVAREAGIHYLAAGHYATERLGVRALGEHLQQRFGIAVEFIDVPNPV